MNGTNVTDELYSLAIRQFLYTYVIPLEIIVGIVAQIFNVFVLHQKSMTDDVTAYNKHLKTLSIAYLLVAPLILCSVLVNNGQIQFQHCYTCMFYQAHIEQYLINLLLFSANIIVITISAEALYSLFNPFFAYSRQSSNFSGRIRLPIFAITGLVLLPVPFTHYLLPNQHGNKWESVQTDKIWLRNIKNICTNLVEIGLLLIVVIIYALTFIRLKHVNSSWRNTASRRRNAGVVVRSSPSGTTTSGVKVPEVHLPADDIGKQALHRSNKAVWTCSAPVVAYIIGNSCSAIKELLRLLQVDLTSPPGRLFVALANCLLVFNFTLNVLLQCLARNKYRRAVSVDMRSALIRKSDVGLQGITSTIEHLNQTFGKMSAPTFMHHHSTASPTSNSPERRCSLTVPESDKLIRPTSAPTSRRCHSESKRQNFISSNFLTPINTPKTTMISLTDDRYPPEVHVHDSLMSNNHQAIPCL